jgi:hypothetical protein
LVNGRLESGYENKSSGVRESASKIVDSWAMIAYLDGEPAAVR